MEKAKQAVSSFISKSGHHDTTVHEKVAPAVQKETINPHQREEQQIVRDREVHQDHYHTSVQPIKDQEVLPEQHHHNLKAVEHHTHDHRDSAQDTKHKLETQAAQFKNESTRAPTHHSTSHKAPEVVGERIHHHVHETVQPVIHKETIEPHVVHTTIPVHETHHNKVQHHVGSTLPAVNMADYKSQGGVLNGRKEQHDHFTGEPNSIDKVGGVVPSHGNTGGAHSSHHTSQNTSNVAKPSLLDKLNPMKDADGDGKRGIMD